MKQGLVRLLYNLGKVHGVDITHDNVCSSMLSCFYSHLLSTGRPISSLRLQLPIVTDGIASSEPQVLPQLHIKSCIATSVCMGNIQNIQTIIRPYK